jgi:adenine-specific DNA methylase
MNDKSRLIEHAFPLKQTSLDSVHEKNVRHGHISTLHIWPARRPLAACRAALIATLLPDPGDPEKRKELCEKIGGRVVEKIEKKKMPNGKIVETVKEETVGGILHWGREKENKETLDWFRQEIRKAYGGRAPKVLDPFAGGGGLSDTEKGIDRYAETKKDTGPRKRQGCRMGANRITKQLIASLTYFVMLLTERQAR